MRHLQHVTRGAASCQVPDQRHHRHRRGSTAVTPTVPAAHRDSPHLGGHAGLRRPADGAGSRDGRGNAITRGRVLRRRCSASPRRLPRQSPLSAGSFIEKLRLSFAVLLGVHVKKPSTARSCVDISRVQLGNTWITGLTSLPWRPSFVGGHCCRFAHRRRSAVARRHGGKSRVAADAASSANGSSPPPRR